MIYDTINNYYEKLVIQYISDHADEHADNDFLADVACVALNKLPVRYIRYDVDMLFYMTVKERNKMTNDVEQAVKSAIEYVKKYQSGRSLKKA